MAPDPGTTSPPFAVFDIDGVVADVSHRLHHLESRPKDWRRLFADAAADTVLEPGARLAEELAADNELVYVTGRPAHLRDVTAAWLQRNHLPPGRLLMRRHRDFRPARTVKLELLRQLSADRPVDVVVDDDLDVVTTLRAAGFAVVLADWASRSAPLHEGQEREGRT